MRLLKILAKSNCSNFQSPFFLELIYDIEKIVGYKLEVENKPNSNFNGYYIMDYEYFLGDNKSYLKIENHKVFILSVPHIFISKIIEDVKPIGLVQMRFMKRENSSFFAPIDFMRVNNFKTIFNYNNYVMSSFPDLRNQHNALAKTIARYIEMYDEWNNNFELI